MCNVFIQQNRVRVIEYAEQNPIYYAVFLTGPSPSHRPVAATDIAWIIRVLLI